VSETARDSEAVEVPAAEDADIEQDLLVEEVSIDGMCGVY
jgi:mycofactocin precursor